MNDATLMTRAVQADPADAVAALALTDLLTESTGDNIASIAAVQLAQASGLLHGTSRKSSRPRGSLCRRVGATGRGDRPISTVCYTIVAGDAEPSYEGESYHYENKSGDRIWHPNAYRRKFGRSIYIPAHHRITVGAEWLVAHAEVLTRGR